MWFCFVLEGSGSVELRNWDSQGGCRGWKLRWIAIERVRFVMSLVAMVLVWIDKVNLTYSSGLEGNWICEEEHTVDDMGAI